MCEAQLEKLNGAANESYSEEIAEKGEKVEDVEKDEVKESDCNIVEKAPNDYAHQESTISDLLFGKKDILSDQQKLAAENLAKEVEMMTNYNSGVLRYVLMQRPYYRLKASVDLFMERGRHGGLPRLCFQLVRIGDEQVRLGVLMVLYKVVSGLGVFALWGSIA